MIDIHSHIVFNVDDGADNIEQSIEMIKEMITNGVTDLICTPHYRLRMFTETKEVIENNFKLLCEEVKKQNLNINLYLGRETYFDKSIYNILNTLEINQKNIILLEFSYTNNPDIEEVIYNIKRLGYRVIIAHVERYTYLKVDDIINMKSKNVYIQVNASTILGKDGLKDKKKAFKLIKAGVVDFIASDMHYHRNNYLKKAYDIISKKFGKEIADKLFMTNALFIID